jgi:hypothetical protein
LGTGCGFVWFVTFSSVIAAGAAPPPFGGTKAFVDADAETVQAAVRAMPKTATTAVYLHARISARGFIMSAI